MSDQRRSGAHRLSLLVTGIVLSFVTSACSVPGLWTYVGADEVAANDQTFDAATYVEGIWTSQVLPTVSEKAVDAGELLPAIAADPKAAATQFGVPSASGGSPSFLIKGTGEVVAVDPESPNGTISVKVGDSEITIVTGPVIIGTSLRDAVGFIGFGDFTNQIDYANVATQLNTKVKTTVSTTVTLDQGLVGRSVTFEGAFTLLTPTDITVVPTVLTVS